MVSPPSPPPSPPCFTITTCLDRCYTRSFLSAGLRSSTVHLQSTTTVRCWTPRHPDPINRPSLLLLHGFGANATWQWSPYLRPLIRAGFDLYIPDLIFFGASSTLRSDRTDAFQADLVMAALDKIGVRKFRGVVGVSYGGFVGYRIAEMFPGAVERVVMICAGVCVEEKDLSEGMFVVNDLKEAASILLPQTPDSLRRLIRLSHYRPPTLLPTCFLSDYIHAYVTQEDVLMTTLSVREAVHYAAELQLPSTMSRAAKRHRADETLHEMGLAGVADVRIGGRTSKGISGGQRRRVSICMEIITRPKLLFLDEPTSGLDSAASFHVISRISKMAVRERMTVAASVHQPGTEVFDLFNSVCILAYGRTVFFGPPASAPEFFAVNGFPTPSLKNPSDHYLKTINKDFERDIEEGDQAKSSGTVEAIEILVNSYDLSEISQQCLIKIDRIRKLGGGDVRKRGHSDFVTQCIVLTRRSFVNMYRDLGYYWLRFAIYVGLCLCVATVFHNIGYSYGSIQARGSVLMFIVSFLTFMAIGGFPSFVEDMKIFERERLNGHYGVGCFTIANTVSSTPFLTLISIVPGGIAYYIVGLQSSVYHFTYFVLVLFSCMMLVEGMMMIVASIVPDFLMGVITGAGIQGTMILSGGYFRLPQDLPKPVWRYPMYYATYHKYAYQGFYKNEFFGLTFPTNIVGSSSTITGDEILKYVWHVEMGYSKWVDLGVLLGMVVLYRVIFFLIVKTWERSWPMLKGLMYKRDSRESGNHKVAEVVDAVK